MNQMGSYVNDGGPYYLNKGITLQIMSSSYSSLPIGPFKTSFFLEKSHKYCL